MNDAEFQMRGLSDPRLAVHATSPLPAWLWSADGTRILWSNLAGAAVFGVASDAELAPRNVGPADPHRRQVARLASRLPATGALRMERLRGFGAAPGMLATCGCSRLDFPDGSHGVLIVAAELTGPVMPRPAPTKATAPPPSQAASSAATPPIVTAQPSPSEQLAPTGEAPAGFALFDAFAEYAAEGIASGESSERALQSVLQLDLPHLE